MIDPLLAMPADTLANARKRDGERKNVIEFTHSSSNCEYVNRQNIRGLSGTLESCRSEATRFTANVCAVMD